MLRKTLIDDEVYMYIYHIQFENVEKQYYIGCRKSKYPFDQDTEYMGSPGKINKKLWDSDVPRKKTLLRQWGKGEITYKFLLNKESEIIEKAWERDGKERCLNKQAYAKIDPEFISAQGKQLYAEGKGGIATLTDEQQAAGRYKANFLTKNAKFVIQDPKGKVYQCEYGGVYVFAKNHNLPGASLHHLVNGEIVQVRGWRRVGDKSIMRGFSHVEFVPKDPEGAYKSKRIREWKSRVSSLLWDMFMNKKLNYITIARRLNIMGERTQTGKKFCSSRCSQLFLEWFPHIDGKKIQKERAGKVIINKGGIRSSKYD